MMHYFLSLHIWNSSLTVFLKQPVFGESFISWLPPMQVFSQQLPRLRFTLRELAALTAIWAVHTHPFTGTSSSASLALLSAQETELAVCPSIVCQQPKPQQRVARCHHLTIFGCVWPALSWRGYWRTSHGTGSLYGRGMQRRLLPSLFNQNLVCTRGLDSQEAPSPMSTTLYMRAS